MKELEPVGEASVSENAEGKLKDLCQNAINLVNYSRSVAIKEINFVQLMTYFILGQWIVQVQQDGAHRAKYGQKVLNVLSTRLNQEYGKGFSVASLTNFRKFYLTYQDRISQPVVTKFVLGKSQPVVTIFSDVCREWHTSCW